MANEDLLASLYKDKVADMYLCKQLNDLTQWNETYYLWVPARNVPQGSLWRNDKGFDGDPSVVPAYDVAYLIRKLPRHITIKKQVYHLCIINGNVNDDNWVADYVTIGRECWLHEGANAQLTEADTVENALVKLAIQLKKRKII